MREEVIVPLIPQEKQISSNETQNRGKGNNHQWMVYLSTFVAVCGYFAFGSCAGYSSPTQFGITEDISLSLAEYSLFGSILTFGAMIGAVPSGKIADFIGREGEEFSASGTGTVVFRSPGEVQSSSAFSDQSSVDISLGVALGSASQISMFVLNQAIGSVEAIAKASKDYILQNTDLSADKAGFLVWLKYLKRLWRRHESSRLFFLLLD